MAVLKLDELVIYGLEQFVPSLTGQRLKTLIEMLFKPAIAPRKDHGLGPEKYDGVVKDTGEYWMSKCVIEWYVPT
jgi:hypothetical protein